MVSSNGNIFRVTGPLCGESTGHPWISHTKASDAELSLRWRHNDRDGISNHQPHDCLLKRLFRHRSKKTSKLRVTDLRAWNSPVTGEFPAQGASNAENISIWLCHHVDVFFDRRLTRNLFFQDSVDREDQLGPVETADMQATQVGNDNEIWSSAKED